MALLFMDSFDHLGTGSTALLLTKWATAVDGGAWCQPNAAAARTGSAGLLISQNAFAALTTNVLPASGAAIVGLAVRNRQGSFNASDLIQVRESSTVHVALAIDTAGKLSIKRGSTVLATGTTALALNTWYYLELKTVIHASAGSYTVRIGGVTELTASGVNTQNGGTGVWDRLVISGCATQGSDVDDLYILDGSGPAPRNDFLGNIRIDARYPSGGGANTGWTPSTGANYTCVDETAPNGDTDYVAATSAGLKDTYAVQDAPVVGGTIYGVQLVWNLKKLDVSACSVAPVVRHAGTDNVGTAQNPTTTYGYQAQAYGTNPGTGAAWVEADFNAAEFGVTRVS